MPLLGLLRFTVASGIVIDRHYFPAELTKAIEDFLFVEVETEVRLDF